MWSIKTWWRSRTSWFPPIGSASRTYIYIWCTSWWKPILIGLSKLPTICPTIFAHILCFSYVFCTIHVKLPDYFCENAAAQGSWTSTFLHRDLKPANLLITSNCDLGLSTTAAAAGEPMTEDVGAQYGSSADMWSVGCILAEILGRKPAFPGKCNRSQLRRIIRVVVSQAEADLDFIDKPRNKAFVQSIVSNGVPFSSLYPDADPLALDLLSSLLVFDPSKRITAAVALAHPYISTLCDKDCSSWVSKSTTLLKNMFLGRWCSERSSIIILKSVDRRKTTSIMSLRRKT